MARQKIEMLLVRKDAPVQTMRIGPWLFYLFMLVLLFILAALAGGGYLLYQQNLAINEMAKDNRRLLLSAQNLETSQRVLQDRAFLANLPDGAPPPPPPALSPPPPAQRPPLSVAPPQKPPAPTAAPQDVPEQTGENEAKDNGAASTPQEAQGVEPWPTSSDWVEVRKVKLKKVGRELLVYFDIANKKGSKRLASGYATVLMRSERKGAPWVEAWPPAKLTPLGRPEDPKKGAHFSVKSFKRFKARFALADKQIQAIEFLIFDEQGELALLVRESMPSQTS